MNNPNNPYHFIHNNEDTPNQDSKNLALLVWLGSIFFYLLPSLLAYFMIREDKFVQQHAKEALNFIITLTLMYIVSGILMLILIGFILVFVVWIFGIIVMILGIIAAYNGKTFHAPLCLRLIK